MIIETFVVMDKKNHIFNIDNFIDKTLGEVINIMSCIGICNRVVIKIFNLYISETMVDNVICIIESTRYNFHILPSIVIAL
jgi:hypothetical protein